MWQAMVFQAGTNAFNASAQNKVASEDYERGMRINIAENQAIQEANIQNTIRTGYRAGILNVQRGQAKMQAVQQGRDVSIKSRQMLGTANANAAASGSIGASIDAVSDDIQRKTDEAQGQVDENWATTQQNFDQQLTDLVQAGIDSIQSARTADYSGPKQQDVWAAAVGGGVQSGASFYQDYAISNMKLGLGKSGTGNTGQTARPTN